MLLMEGSAEAHQHRHIYAFASPNAKLSKIIPAAREQHVTACQQQCMPRASRDPHNVLCVNAFIFDQLWCKTPSPTAVPQLQ